MHGMSRTLGQPIPGIDAFCAPVFDSTHNIVLGITAMGPRPPSTATGKAAWRCRCAPRALEISRRLGYVPPEALAARG